MTQPMQSDKSVRLHDWDVATHLPLLFSDLTCLTSLCAPPAAGLDLTMQLAADTAPTDEGAASAADVY